MHMSMKIIFLLYPFLFVSMILSNSFLDNNDGTISDQATKLIWQKCSMGQKNDSKCSGRITALSILDAEKNCNDLDLAGKKWRLPSLKELQSLVLKKSKPTIDQNFFPKTKATFYWTSDLDGKEKDNRMFVTFATGGIGSAFKSSKQYVRCVSSL
jgi:hypothetical protein